ncbi:MAG: hypothetical protein ABTD50_00250 [Polyangiaceae bacterium]
MTNKTSLQWICGCALGGVIGLGCTSSTGASADPYAAFGQKFELSNEISSYKPDVGIGYATYTADTLTSYDDGQAGEYTDLGMLYAAVQTLDGPSSEQALVVSMDFGTGAKAQAMFLSSTSSTAPLEAVGSWDSSTVTAHPSLASLEVFAVFGEYYFEITLSGYGDQTGGCTACTDATAFLNALKAKAQ